LSSRISNFSGPRRKPITATAGRKNDIFFQSQQILRFFLHISGSKNTHTEQMLLLIVLCCIARSSFFSVASAKKKSLVSDIIHVLINMCSFWKLRIWGREEGHFLGEGRLGKLSFFWLNLGKIESW